MVNNLSFDDPSDEGLDVISAYELLISELDVADPDWGKIAERTAIDERRGLVIAQVAEMEQVIDDFILYVADPDDVSAYMQRLAAWTIGPRVKEFERLLRVAGVCDEVAVDVIGMLLSVVARRNLLAHGSLYLRPTKWTPIGQWDGVEFEWMLRDPRTGHAERISMAGLRTDLEDVIDATVRLIRYGSHLAAQLPPPSNYANATYIAPMQPMSTLASDRRGQGRAP